MSASGSTLLLRFHLRRDRRQVAWWSAGAGVLYWSQAVSTKALYPSQAELDRAAAAMERNAAFVAMAGPARALNTLGGQVAWQASAFGAVVAGLMSMFLVGRHTRTEEDTGRDELLRAGATGRHASLAAVALVVLLANGVLGTVVALSLVFYGLPVPGSVSLALAAALSGLVFGALTLVAAQLAGSARGAYGIAGAAIGASYVLRGVGDIGHPALSWLSPIGWGQAMHAFSGERWWPALLPVAATAALCALAMWLFDRRDFGTGLLATRAGPRRAGPSLRGPLGLAWRLQRSALAGWVLGLLVTGLAYGAVGDSPGDVVGNSSFSRDLFGSGGASLTDSFYAVAAAMLGLMATGFAVSSALRLRAEDEAGRVEPLLATAVTRTRWALGGLVVTVGGSVAAVAAAGLGLGSGYALVTGDSSAVGRLFAATVQGVCAVLVLAAVTWLLYAVSPRWATAGWLTVGFSTVVMLFGRTLRLPQWLKDVSPFTHLPAVPAESFAWPPVLWLILVAVACGAAGTWALRHRDIS